jgi:hypothetical protein
VREPRPRARFLETHRYAALVGASMGFTKMEGTTVNYRDKFGAAVGYLTGELSQVKLSKT